MSVHVCVYVCARYVRYILKIPIECDCITNAKEMSKNQKASSEIITIEIGLAEYMCAVAALT